MNVLLNTENIDNCIKKNKIYFNNPIRNTVLDEDSLFVKILFSDENIVLNGIYLYLNLNTTEYINNNNNTNKKIFNFSIEKNKKVLEEMFLIEEKILSYYSNNSKQVYCLKDMLSKGYLKIYSENSQSKNIYVKISGLWKKTSSNEIGLTYKIQTV